MGGFVFGQGRDQEAVLNKIYSSMVRSMVMILGLLALLAQPLTVDGTARARRAVQAAARAATSEWTFRDVARVGTDGFTSIYLGRSGANGTVIVDAVRGGRDGIFRVDAQGAVAEVAVEGTVLPGGLGTLSGVGSSTFDFVGLANGDVLFKARAVGGSLNETYLYTFHWREGQITLMNPSSEVDPITFSPAFIHDLLQTTTDSRWLNGVSSYGHPTSTARYALGDGVNNPELFTLTSSVYQPPNCVSSGQNKPAVNAAGQWIFVQSTMVFETDGPNCVSYHYTNTWQVRLGGDPGGVLAQGTLVQGEGGMMGESLEEYTPLLFNNTGQLAAMRRIYNDPAAAAVRYRLSVFDAGAEQLIADTDGPFKALYLTDFDQQGRVLYSATFDSDPNRAVILDGPDPAANRVVGEGDTLFGQTLTSLSLLQRPAAMEDSQDRRFAFSYRLANGAVGIAEAVNRPVRVPVFILPGIAGSYAADQSDDYTWLMNRGAHPDGLVVDPLGGFYDDIVLTFEALGYIQGVDLFVANYDWRLPPGPLDGTIDGKVSGLTGAGIADENFLYAVDYLGYYLRQAEETWRLAHGEPLEKVHVIAHSTGGLVARTYLQSDAYGDLYDGVNRLPKIDHFIMIGVPNRGASKPYNPLQDNWVADPAYQMLLSKIVNRAYVKLLAGQTINGPDYDIQLADIQGAGGALDLVKFVELYVPTLRALLATYDFYSDGGAYRDLNETAERNTWVLDLNNGLDLGDVPPADPNAFADQCTLTVIFGTSENTKWLTRRLSGPAKGVLSPFSDFFSNDAAPGQTYYLDVAGEKNGDGTVPTISAAGQFMGDPRVTLLPMTVGVTTSFPADHTALVGNRDVQRAILNRLQIEHSLTDIHQGAGASLSSVLSVISDPVELVLEDGLGRRLGYTAATGKLEEIPGSKWFGGAEGTGWLLGPVVPPLKVTLTGLGEDYYVHVAVSSPFLNGGWSGAGTLAAGETLDQPVDLRAPEGMLFLSLIQR